ncbi:hypothetical protein GUJ93_ZPchr0012g22238 [Zizania palustris]|uniref:Uncharacterized protein n=1 Tax=Zizania palustris TaxID=103762 RepID=A0A8J6BZJ3_ZIZPA|nr:hypothetical protein GUJ93_ZPchr0012g19224 [Zizania palustris]KAG8095296.1 hypothetical protein GUJ93_ZPchr0012g22238 [Zizania palustris]
MSGNSKNTLLTTTGNKQLLMGTGRRGVGGSSVSRRSHAALLLLRTGNDGMRSEQEGSLAREEVKRRSPVNDDSGLLLMGKTKG